MERRKTPRKEWTIAQDEVGRAVLKWQPDPFRARRMQETDPCARTYDFLNRLEVPGLKLEDEVAPRQSRAFNPYDHSVPVRRKNRDS